MSEDKRDPESLLKQIKEQANNEHRGKLKIYLGAAPGVGKTYSMLEDANQKRKEDLDVIIGIIETHGRKDLEKLLISLEELSRQKIDYKGHQLQEFDLDAAIKRAPALILIDEMAHSNAPGTRHAKRWQDIKELLDRGIDVYTTLNVQHIESLNNDVSKIIHAPIKETVPDSMLELANTIELVDLPPEDLLQRLQEGKVYFPAQAEIAKDKFFRKENLIALRELALRITAQRVGEQVSLYRKGLGIKHIWSSNEKILVCVSPGNECLELIRAARRLSSSIQATWLAVFVDSKRNVLSDAKRNNAIKNLRFAEQLGAQTAVLAGDDIVKEIMLYAREQNVTLIMVWKNIVPRWKDFWRLRLADEIVRNSGEINVYIMTGVRDKDNAKDKVVKPQAAKLSSILNIYAMTLAIVTLTTLLSFILLKYTTTTNVILVYVVSVIVVVMFGKLGPVVFASLLSLIAYNWLFAPHAFAFTLTKFTYIILLLLAIVLAQIINNLTQLNKRQAEAAHKAERKAIALHRLSQKLASARGVMKLLEVGTKYIAEFFDAEVMVLLPDNDQLTVKLMVNTDKVLNAKELGVAQWVYELGQIAGVGTDTLPQADALYIPLLASQTTMGVLRVRPLNSEKLLTPDQMNFLETCANQIALTMEVDFLQEHKKQIEVQHEINHTRNILLQSISQDLRSPLAAIMLTAKSQMQMANSLNATQVYDLAQNIFQESDQLSRLINNLLQITYLENNTIKLHKESWSLQKVLDDVIRSFKEKLANTPVQLHIPIEIPLVPFDRVLMEGVFINLLENALKFSPQGGIIDIFAQLEKTRGVIVSFQDRGPGIYGDEVSKLFEKFYTGRMLTSKRGLGLGLAICRIIIEAHGGQIWAENREGGGAVFKFILPLD